MPPARREPRPRDDDRPGRADAARVLAAGGLVWRESGAGGDRGAGVEPGASPAGLEVVLVHRPRYDDWSFPKGKLSPGETFEQAALREVAEETGLVCTLGHELPPTRYRDARGRPKLVRYWTMRVVAEGPWRPTAEVDARRWATVDEAGALLTYGHDRLLLDRFRRRPR